MTRMVYACPDFLGRQPTPPHVNHEIIPQRNWMKHRMRQHLYRQLKSLFDFHTKMKHLPLYEIKNENMLYCPKNIGSKRCIVEK